MIRKAFKMKVYPEKLDEYVSRHNPIWTELQETLKEHGVHNYSIFIDPETHILFAYAEIESELKWNAIASTPICQKWWAYMKDLMETNPDNSPKSSELKSIFYLP